MLVHTAIYDIKIQLLQKQHVRETYVLINCDLGKEQQIVEFLQRLQNVREVQATYGVYDIIAKIKTTTERELNDTIRSKILGLRQVSSVLTLQVE